MATKRKRLARNVVPELTPAQLFELITGISVHPDRYAFKNRNAMREAWRDHAPEIKAWRDKHYPGEGIWIEP
jgi:hypothetical protein